MKIKNILLYILFVVSFVHRSCQDGFQKELSINIAFPPILERREGIPTGHLRPLGWQNRAEASVKEDQVSLSADKFWDDYVNKSEPLVIRGLVMGSEAIDKWSDIYLNRAYGYLDIKVTERKQTFRSIEENKTQMTLKKFLQNYRVEDWYLRGIMPEEMQAEAPIAHLLNCGPYIYDDVAEPSSDSSEKEKERKGNKKNKNSNEDEKSKEKFRTKLAKEILSPSLVESEPKYAMPKIAQLIEPYIWMSAGETSSLLHSHPENNLHCVIDGRKDFILIPVNQFDDVTTSTDPKKKSAWRRELDLYQTFDNSDEWYSKIDVDKVNAYKYKLLARTKWYWSSLHAGDCIFVPSGWLHQIRSYGRGISTSVYFNTLQIDPASKSQLSLIKSEQFAMCDTHAPIFTPLSTVANHFLWTYTHTERHLQRKSFTCASHARLYLLYLVRQDARLYFSRFVDFYDEITAEIKREVDTYVPSIRALVSLNSTDVWQDFYDEQDSSSMAATPTATPTETATPTADRTFLTIEQIVHLNEANFDRFIKILNLVANYHEFGSEYKLARDEL